MSTLAGCAALAAARAQAGVLAHFKLDEGAADPFVYVVASTVGGWTGELLTDTTFAPAWITSGLPNVPTGTTAAVGFDSTDSGNDPRIATTCPGVLGDGARTVAAWIKGDLQQPNFGVIVAWGRNATAGRYTFRVETATGANTGKLRLEVQGHALVGDTVVMDGSWHHVAVVTPQGGSAHTSTLYVDGVPQSRTLFGTAAPLNTLVDLAVPAELVHIGNGGWSLGAYGFKGQIDDVRLYDEALSDAQILELAAGAGTPPTLTQPLANQTIVLGDPAAQATFTAAASGSPPLAFEWKFNGAVLTGQTGASLTLNPATPADAGDYTVTVSNAAGTVSSTARLLLGTGPVELNQQAALVGEPVAFRVTMPSGPAYTYQWRFNGADLPGQTSAVLALEDLEAADAGAYAVRVTLGSNSAQSSDAVLRVLPVPTSPYAAAILRDGPAAYWRLGESAGATQAADATGFHPAAFVNFTGVELGQPGAILNEPATDTAVLLEPFTPTFAELSLPPELNDVRAFSVEAWVKPNFLVEGTLVSASFTLPSRGYQLDLLSSGAFRFRTAASLNPSNPTWSDLSGGTAVEGEWSHVVATYDGAVKRLYVNGLPVGEQAVAVWPSLGLFFRLGAGNGSTAAPGSVLDGTLDEVAVYRRALSAAAIATHYRASGRALEGVLTYELGANGLTLAWEGDGWILQGVESLSALWADVEGATSPWTVSAASGTRFFRLTKP